MSLECQPTYFSIVAVRNVLPCRVRIVILSSSCYLRYGTFLCLHTAKNESYNQSFLTSIIWNSVSDAGEHTTNQGGRYESGKNSATTWITTSQFKLNANILRIIFSFIRKKLNLFKTTLHTTVVSSLPIRYYIPRWQQLPRPSPNNRSLRGNDLKTSKTTKKYTCSREKSTTFEDKSKRAVSSKMVTRRHHPTTPGDSAPAAGAGLQCSPSSYR